MRGVLAAALQQQIGLAVRSPDVKGFRREFYRARPKVPGAGGLICQLGHLTEDDGTALFTIVHGEKVEGEGA
jgi:hypothetical protein